MILNLAKHHMGDEPKLDAVRSSWHMYNQITCKLLLLSHLTWLFQVNLPFLQCLAFYIISPFHLRLFTLPNTYAKELNKFISYKTLICT